MGAGFQRCADETRVLLRLKAAQSLDPTADQDDAVLRGRGPDNRAARSGSVAVEGQQAPMQAPGKTPFLGQIPWSPWSQDLPSIVEYAAQGARTTGVGLSCPVSYIFVKAGNLAVACSSQTGSGHDARVRGSVGPGCRTETGKCGADARHRPATRHLFHPDSCRQSYRPTIAVRDSVQEVVSDSEPSKQKPLCWSFGNRRCWFDHITPGRTK
jgi:hypothetical protein